MREPGAILLVSCYELGHQPLAVAWAAAFLEARGYAPAVMDVSVEPFDADKAARARLVAVSVPMHTALRVGVEVIARVRAVNPACHVVAYGLYAAAQPGVPPRPRRRRGDRRRGGGAAGDAGGDARVRVRRAGRRGRDGRAPGRSPPRAAAVSGPEPRGAAVPQAVRAARARRPARARGLRRGEPGLQAPLPALPDPAGLRRALLRRAARGRAGGRPPVRPGRGDPRHLRRPRLPQRAAARARRGARPPCGVPARDLRLHREGRASAQAPRAPAGGPGRSAARSSSRRWSRSATRCWPTSTRATRAPTSWRSSA